MSRETYYRVAFSEDEGETWQTWFTGTLARCRALSARMDWKQPDNLFRVERKIVESTEWEAVK